MQQLGVGDDEEEPPRKKIAIVQPMPPPPVWPTIDEVTDARKPICLLRHHMCGLLPLIKEKLDTEFYLFSNMIEAQVKACCDAQLLLQVAIFQHVFVKERPEDEMEKRAGHVQSTYSRMHGIDHQAESTTILCNGCETTTVVYANFCKCQTEMDCSHLHLEPYGRSTYGGFNFHHLFDHLVGAHNKEDFLEATLPLALLKHHIQGLIPLLADRVENLTQDGQILGHLRTFVSLVSTLLLLLETTCSLIYKAMGKHQTPRQFSDDLFRQAFRNHEGLQHDYDPNVSTTYYEQNALAPGFVEV